MTGSHISFMQEIRQQLIEKFIPHFPIICAMVKSRVFLGMGDIPPFNRNPYNGYINPYYWVDDHPLLYGNNGSLDPGTYIYRVFIYMLLKNQGAGPGVSSGPFTYFHFASPFSEGAKK